jgi:hypothetical protein
MLLDIVRADLKKVTEQAIGAPVISLFPKEIADGQG